MNFNLKLLVMCLAFGQNSPLFCPPKRLAPATQFLLDIVAADYDRRREEAQAADPRIRRATEAYNILRTGPEQFGPEIHEARLLAYKSRAKAYIAEWQAREALRELRRSLIYQDDADFIIQILDARTRIRLARRSATLALERVEELVLRGTALLTELDGILREINIAAAQVNMTVEEVDPDFRALPYQLQVRVREHE